MPMLTILLRLIPLSVAMSTTNAPIEPLCETNDSEPSVEGIVGKKARPDSGQ